jgi:pheromone shutdown protein TraB
LSAPLTLLTPPVGAGMVVGLAEACLRRPTAADSERLSHDITTFAGVRRNPFSRVLLVVLTSSLGAILGALVGMVWVLFLL